MAKNISLGTKANKGQRRGNPIVFSQLCSVIRCFCQPDNIPHVPLPSNSLSKTTNKDGDKGNVGLIILPGCSQQYSVNFPSLLFPLFHSKSLSNMDLKKSGALKTKVNLVRAHFSRPTLFPKQPFEDGDKGNVGLPNYIVRLSPLLHV